MTHIITGLCLRDNACVAVCPVECCLHDPKNVETEEVLLSRRGRLWSYTNNCYAPPPPFVASDPFQPYAVAAVELEKERMVVLGQVEAGVNVPELEVGMEMELTLGTLYENPEREVVIWKWRPLAAEGRA